MPVTGRGGEIMVWSNDMKVRTRPLHSFSLLVEFVKGGDYPPISPPMPPRLWSHLLLRQVS